MAPPKPASTMLSTLIDVSSEDDFARSDMEMMPTPDSQPENKQPAKRKAGRPKAGATDVESKTSKTKSVSRRASNNGAKNTKTKPRRALSERANVPNDGNETEEVDDFEDEVENVPAKSAKRGKAAKAAKEEARPANVRKTATKSSATAQAKTSRSKQATYEAPESQPEPMEIEATELEVEETIVDEPKPVRKLTARQPLVPQLSSRARSSSRQPDPYTRHRRAGSASDTERAGEPALRRKLGEITRRFENLELKYKNLKELGSNDAQSNFDRLRKSADQRAKDQDELIASLKKELVSSKALSAESRSLRAQNATLQAENQRITSENRTLSSSLTSSQNEVKALQAKLASARNNVASDVQATKIVPGSAVKGRGGVAAATKREEQTNERIRIMQLKEDLYSDLTGLMIHNVKRMEEEDIYDCIQTGRNGTLRFHLSVSHIDKATATPGTAYDEEEFAYAPLLDEKNDSALLEILPDYLTEEIVFPRPSAAKFYLKVIDCMSKRFVEE